MTHRLAARAAADDTKFARLAAALASVGAAVAHLAVVPEHLREWWPAGLFFGAIAAFQAGWPALVQLRPGRVLLATGVLVNAASIALWAVSRTSGVPFGPNAGIAEPITRVGVLTVALEAIVCLAALWWLSRARPRSFLSAPAYLSSAVAAALVVGTLTTGAVTGAAGGHAHESGGHSKQPAGTGHTGEHHEPATRPTRPPEPGQQQAPAGPTEPGTGGVEQHDHGSH